MILSALSPRMTAFALLLGGGVALDAASLIAVRALAGGDPRRPGGRAVGHWLPIAAAALAAVVLRRSDVATGVLFATSVACLSLMMGLLSYFSTTDATPPRPADRRAWPFVLPAAMLAMMAGFSSRLSILHAGMMALLGLAVWSVWTDPDAAAAPDEGPARDSAAPDGATEERATQEPATQEPATQERATQGRATHQSAAPDSAAQAGAAEVGTAPRVENGPDDSPAAGPPPPARGAPVHRALLALAIVLGVAGAWAAVSGVVVASETSRLPAGLLAAAVLSPLLTMPMLASASTLGERGQATSMATTLVGVALLNLCALLPAAVIVWHVLPGATQFTSRVLNLAPAAVASSQPETIDDAYAETDGSLLGSLRAGAEPMPYPLTVWRIDTVILVVLGFALLPVALGRWTIGRAEATGLMIGYAVYLALVMALAGRV